VSVTWATSGLVKLVPTAADCDVPDTVETVVPAAAVTVSVWVA